MHGFVHDWVKAMVTLYRLGDLHTLELGSYDVNGGIRDLFTDHHGVDMRAGPGVDEVVNGESLPYPDASYQLVVTTETLEHVQRPWLFVKEAARVLSPGGFFLVTTCDYGFPYHEFPDDFWRYSPGGLSLLMGDHALTVIERGGEPGLTIFMAARKG